MELLLAVDGAILSRGLAIAFSGLVIVFVALLLISLFIASLPKLLVVVAKVWPEVDEPHAIRNDSVEQPITDGHILAAIGFVLHTELQKQRMAESNKPGSGAS